MNWFTLAMCNLFIIIVFLYVVALMYVNAGYGKWFLIKVLADILSSITLYILSKYG